MKQTTLNMEQIKELKAQSWKEKAIREINKALKAQAKGVFLF